MTKTSTIAIITLTISATLVVYSTIQQYKESQVTISRPVKQQDSERYYCHETGFLMHHWQMQKGTDVWLDTLERDHWNGPIKCDLP